MTNYIVRGIAFLFALIAGLALVVVAVNWNDEPLRPEVRAALEWKVPEHAFEDNGYLILLGMNAPAGQDASATGRKILEAELEHYRTYLKTHEPPDTPKITATPSDLIKSMCNSGEEKNCVNFYLAQNAHKRKALLRKYAFLTDRFRLLRQSRNYIEASPPYSYSAFPGYASLISAAKLEHIRTIPEISRGNLQAGINHFIESARSSRRLLKKSSTLISDMIALAMIRIDMDILSELLEKYPQLARYQEQLTPVLKPISAPEYSMANAFVYERSFALQTINASKYEAATSGQSWYQAISNKFNWIFFKINETMNLAYAMFEIRLKVARADASHLDAALANAEQDKNKLFGAGIDNLYYLRDPVGKILLQIPSPVYEDYLERQYDTDGYVRLVALQLKLIAGQVPAAGIPDALKKSGVELRNPYTLQPMKWDATRSELSFTGRYSADSKSNKKNIYTVKLPQLKA